MSGNAPDASSLGQAERDFSQVDKHRLVTALARVLPPTCLLHDLEDLRPYECDGMAALRQLPLVVALPETEAQVVDILKICAEQAVPVVARGAGTGLSGGAQPHRFGLVLSLARLKKILHIDAHARRAVVQPGVRNLAISEAAAPHGLYYAPDPSSQIACTIGGNVAENSGGVHCLKYGLTVHNVLRIRVVSIEGEVFEIGSEAPDAPGYDLLALLIGSEGMLGVVTEVTVKLVPKPELAQVVMASFNDVAKAGGKVDSAAPTVTAAADKEERTLTLTADDGTGSGVASIEYRIGTDGQWATYSKPIAAPSASRARASLNSEKQECGDRWVGQRPRGLSVNISTPCLTSPSGLPAVRSLWQRCAL